MTNMRRGFHDPPWIPWPSSGYRMFLLIPLWNLGSLKDERKIILDILGNKFSIGKGGYVAAKRESQ